MTQATQTASILPPDDALRLELHNEVHARPTARIQLPALITYVAVLNDGITREMELAHLRLLCGQQDLPASSVRANFLRLQCQGYTLKWERHTEFSRYSLVRPLAPDDDGLQPGGPADWLRGIPGRTISAVQMLMQPGYLPDDSTLQTQARQWFAEHGLVGSQLGQGHSWAITDFQVGSDGFERMLVVTHPDGSPTRAGRLSQRLLELETYRLLALRGLPVAKRLGAMLTQTEAELAAITARLEAKDSSDEALLDTLVALAARVERNIAEHNYRFAATQAYYSLVNQRIAQLREEPLPGHQSLGQFMQRRLSPAMATVASAAGRLASLSERVSRTSALLRTRVDIASERQNQRLLEKLTRGQELQLHLQHTVEGLSIAAISYYVISLLLYGAKALKVAGLPLNPEMLVGALVPVVLWAVWRTTRKLRSVVMHKE